MNNTPHMISISVKNFEVQRISLFLTFAQRKKLFTFFEKLIHITMYIR